MTKIVDFPKEKTEEKLLIWVCNCGCVTFELFSDGSAICANCGAVSGNGGWNPPENASEHNGEVISVVRGNGPDEPDDFTRALVARRMADPKCVFSTALLEDGTISVWSSYDYSGPGKVQESIDTALALLGNQERKNA